VEWLHNSNSQGVECFLLRRNNNKLHQAFLTNSVLVTVEAVAALRWARTVLF